MTRPASFKYFKTSPEIIRLAVMLSNWRQNHGEGRWLIAFTSAPNLRAVQLLLGHTKVDSTVRYLGIELDDALSIAEKIDL